MKIKTYDKEFGRNEDGSFKSITGPEIAAVGQLVMAYYTGMKPSVVRESQDEMDLDTAERVVQALMCNAAALSTYLGIDREDYINSATGLFDLYNSRKDD